MSVVIDKIVALGGGGGSTNVTSTAVIADNSIVRGDGGARGVQDSPLTIGDASGSNVTVTTTTGLSLTLATLDGNKNIIITPHGTGHILLGSSTDNVAYPSVEVGADGKTGFSRAASGAQMDFWVTGVRARGFLMYSGGAGSGQFSPITDLDATAGGSTLRFKQLFLGPTGIKLGDGTNGPTITATGSSPNQDLVFTANNTGSNVLLGNTYSDSNFKAIAARFVTSDFVNGSVGTGLMVSFGATTGNTFAQLCVLQTGTTTFGGALVVQPSGAGNVLIGTSTDDTVSKLQVTGSIAQSGKTAKYNNVATAGWGVPAIYAAGTIAGTVDARSAAVATYTVGAADGSFEVGGNVNVITSTTHSFSLDVVYTDETNTSRTLILPIAQLGGGFITGGLITNVTGAGPYETSMLVIRCKASTAITIRPSATGTYTTVTYNVNAHIKQVA